MNCKHFGLDEIFNRYAYYCRRFGWPELDGLCPDHFREHYVVPAQITEFEQGQLVAKLQHRVYLVEVAMGLRPCVAGPVNCEPLQKSSRPSPTQRNVEDLEEME